MTYTFFQPDQDRQKNYDDAKKDLIQAMNSISKLDDYQKRQLISEFANAGAVLNFYSLLQQRFG